MAKRGSVRDAAWFSIEIYEEFKTSSLKKCNMFSGHKQRLRIYITLLGPLFENNLLQNCMVLTLIFGV